MNRCLNDAGWSLGGRLETGTGTLGKGGREEERERERERDGGSCRREG